MGAVKTIRQSTPAELEWFCKGLQYAPQMDMKGLTGIDSKGLVVAIIGFDGWTHGSVCLHSWISPGALTRNFMREVARYPFDSGRKVLIGKTPANNAKALRFNKHYGFTEVYRIRDGFADGVDMVIQELRHDACRWYKHGNGSNVPGSSESATAGTGGAGSTEDTPAELCAAPADSPAAADDCDGKPAAYGPVWRATPAGTTTRPTSWDGCPSARPVTEVWPSPVIRRGHVPDNYGLAGGSSAAGTTVPASSARDDATSAESGSGGSGNPNARRPYVAKSRWYSSTCLNGQDEDVTVEPRCDIEAQLEDLARPGSKRLAVFLSPRNEEAHPWAIGDPRVGFVYMLAQGTLLFRSWDDCNKVECQLREKKPVRQVIGEAVLAGSGKPEFTPDACVAQMLDNSGSVARESIQPSRPAAFDKLAEWMKDYPAGQAQVVTIAEALLRRASQVTSTPRSLQ